MRFVIVFTALMVCGYLPTYAQERSLEAFSALLQPEVTPLGRMTIDDQRPSETRRTRALTAVFHNCHNGVWQMGDDRVMPDRLARLEVDLTNRFNEEFDGQLIVVRRYAVFFNMRAWQEGAVIAPHLGALGSAFLPPGANEPVSLRAKCSQERMPLGGWFDTSELTNNFSPFVVEIDLSLAGEDYAVRSVYSPPLELGPHSFRAWGRPHMQAGAQQALAQANQVLIEAILQRRAVR